MIPTSSSLPLNCSIACLRLNLIGTTVLTVVAVLHSHWELRSA